MENSRVHWKRKIRTQNQSIKGKDGKRKRKQGKTAEAVPLSPEQELGKIISYGLRMVREQINLTTPAYHRPLKDQYELLTFIMYKASKEFRSAVVRVYLNLSFNDKQADERVIRRQENRAAQNDMQHQVGEEIVKEALNPQDDPEKAKYRFLEERIRSFRGWPHTRISPNELAAEGFYYTGEQDWVYCYECGAAANGWEKDRHQSARSAHHGASQQCMILAGFPSGREHAKIVKHLKYKQNARLPFSTGIHGESHLLRTLSILPPGEWDYPDDAVEKGYTHIWNLELNFGKEGFAGKAWHGNCQECGIDFPVHRGCTLCSQPRLESIVYIVSMACPNPVHRRALQCQDKCYLCQQGKCLSDY